MQNASTAVQHAKEEASGDGNGFFSDGNTQKVKLCDSATPPASSKRSTGPQATFQPGSTASPFRRFLNWNEHGVVQYVAAGEQGSLPAASKMYDRIEVKFSGHTKVMSDRASDTLRLAAVGPGCCALTHTGVDSDSLRRPAKLQVFAVTDWGKPLLEKLFPPEEEVEAMAISKDFLVIATSRRFLHVMTTRGLSIGLLSLPGPVVVITSFNDLFLVVFQCEDQCVDYWLLSAKMQSRISAGRLPLSPGSRVAWVGFTVDALPLVLDSAGVLRGLIRGEGAFASHQSLGGSWVPLIDLASLASQGKSLWPVRAESEELFCVEVTEGSEPEVGPTHELRAVKFSMPVGVRVECPEEAMLRSRVFASHLTQVLGEGSLQPKHHHSATEESRQRSQAAAKLALRLFGYYCENGEVEKALDVAACFNSYDVPQNSLFTLAYDFAHKSQCYELADRIRTMAPPAPKRAAEEAEAPNAPPARVLRSGA